MRKFFVLFLLLLGLVSARAQVYETPIENPRITGYTTVNTSGSTFNFMGVPMRLSLDAGPGSGGLMVTSTNMDGGPALVGKSENGAYAIKAAQSIYYDQPALRVYRGDWNVSLSSDSSTPALEVIQTVNLTSDFQDWRTDDGSTLIQLKKDGTLTLNNVVIAGAAIAINGYGPGNTQATNSGVAIGINANADNYSAAIGLNSTGLNQGSAVGWGSNGSYYGSALGYAANGSGYGVAVGAYSIATNSNNSALGYYARVPSGYANTVELGSGTAALNGGLNFRGVGIVDWNGGSPTLASGLASAFDTSGTAASVLASSLQKSGGTATGLITMNGGMVAASGTFNGPVLSHSTESVNGANWWGIVGWDTWTPTTSNYPFAHSGILGQVELGGSANITADVSDVIGVGANIVTKSGSGWSGSATGASAFQGGITVLGTGTITNGYGLYLTPIAQTGIQHAYGIYQKGANDTNVFNGPIVGPSYSSGTTNATDFTLYDTWYPSGSFNAVRTGLSVRVDQSGGNNLNGPFGLLTGAGPNNSGTSAVAYGLRSSIFSYNSSRLTNGYALSIDAPGVAGSGTITTAYGLYINPQKEAGVGTGYGVYQQGSLDTNHFDGPIDAPVLSNAAITAPNQTLSGGSNSVMTEKLVKNYILAGLAAAQLSYPISTFSWSGSGSPVTISAPVVILSGSASVANFYSTWHSTGAHIWNQTNNGNGGTNLSWGRPFAVSVSFCVGYAPNSSKDERCFRIRHDDSYDLGYTPTTSGLPSYAYATGFTLLGGTASIFSLNNSTLVSSTYGAVSLPDVSGLCIVNDTTNLTYYLNTTSGWTNIGHVPIPSSDQEDVMMEFSIRGNGVATDGSNFYPMADIKFTRLEGL